LKFKRRISTSLNTGGGRKEISVPEGLEKYQPLKEVAGTWSYGNFPPGK